METKDVLPRRVVRYIHEMGVRSLDHLAENFEPPGNADAEPTGVQSLVGHWKTLSIDEKERFVERVAVSIVEVIAASAVLPLGAKLGKKAAKSAKKVIRKEAKRIRKAAKSKAAKRPARSRRKKKSA